MRQRDDLGPTAWNCHLHPSLRFSGSSNHLIHALLAVALGNVCPQKLLQLGTLHSVPRLFLLRLSMPPTATHQQDNSYGRSAIWRVSKFVIPLIVRRNGTGDLRFPHLTFSVIVSFVVKFVNLKGTIRILHAGDVLCCVEQPNEVHKNPSKTLSRRSVILEEIIWPVMSVCE